VNGFLRNFLEGRAWPRDQWVQFGWWSGSQSGSSSPKSEIRIHWIMEKLPILLKFYGELGCGLEANWLHFGDDPDHRPDPGVRYGFRNLHSLDYWRSYQWILMKFYRELGCSLETNWLHFGDDPDHRPGVRSPKSGFTGLSIMLAFGGGLRCLSTAFSFISRWKMLRFVQNFQMAISPRRIVQFTACLVLRWGFRGRQIEWR